VDSAIEIAEAVRHGQRRAVDVLDECLERIDATNGALNAFVHVDADMARKQADAVDQALASGADPGPFAGVPMGVKDLEDCAGMPTSHGSLWFKDRGPVARDSVHVNRLRNAGAVFVGKTAAPEFGIPCFTHTKAWGTTRNPWMPERTPGGSSGGSASAVAAGMVPCATASDGGGSTRIPAAFCGLVGLKPSYGRIPHERSAPSQTSTFGLLATTVADVARHLDVTAGPHNADRTSLPPPTLTYERAIDEIDVRGLRAVWSLDMGYGVLDPELADITHDAAQRLVAAAGLDLLDRDFTPGNALKVWGLNGCLDEWVDLEPGLWPDRSDELGGLARRAFERTSPWPIQKVAHAFERRLDLDEEMGELFDEIDVLLTPTTAVPAFMAEGPMPFVIDGREAIGGPTPFTMLANMTWNPAVSVPAGVTRDGLPVGLQIVVRRHRDEVALRLARVMETAAPWPRLAPDPR
jgi:aspartyl-tRNA(Asn)/glutamyl-tRNA(Gln) amidotransferase subunit A